MWDEVVDGETEGAKSFIIKNFLLSPRIFLHVVHSFQCKDLGDLESWPDNVKVHLLIYFSGDPLTQSVTFWKKPELLRVLITPSPFLECFEGTRYQ